MIIYIGTTIGLTDKHQFFGKDIGTSRSAHTFRFTSKPVSATTRFAPRLFVAKGFELAFVPTPRALD